MALQVFTILICLSASSFFNCIIIITVFLPHCSPQSKFHDPALHQLLHKVNNYTLKYMVWCSEMVQHFLTSSCWPWLVNLIVIYIFDLMLNILINCIACLLIALIFLGHAKGLRVVVGRVPQVGCNNCICKLLKDNYRHRKIWFVYSQSILW